LCKKSGKGSLLHINLTKYEFIVFLVFVNTKLLQIHVTSNFKVVVVLGCNGCNSSRDFSRGGGQRGHFAPLKMVLPPELCLNDKIDFNMIKVLPPSIFERLDLPLLNLFSKNPCVLGCNGCSSSSSRLHTVL